MHDVRWVVVPLTCGAANLLFMRVSGNVRRIGNVLVLNNRRLFVPCLVRSEFLELRRASRIVCQDFIGGLHPSAGSVAQKFALEFGRIGLASAFEGTAVSGIRVESSINERHGETP